MISSTFLRRSFNEVLEIITKCSAEGIFGVIPSGKFGQLVSDETNKIIYEKKHTHISNIQGQINKYGGSGAIA